MSLTPPTRMRVTVLALALLQAGGVAAQHTSRPEDLAERIDAVLDAPAFDEAFWGVLAIDLETGDTLYARNPDKRFMPASNVKLLTTAAALDGLGPTFQYTTNLFSDGPVEGGELHGNLVIQGSGDPTLGSARFGAEEPIEVFVRWAEALQQRGIRRIRGDVIGDDDVFDDIPYGLGWAWDDFVHGYGAETSGLTFHEAAVQLSIDATTPGARAAISWKPMQTDYISVENLSVTQASGNSTASVYARSLGGNHFTISTRIADGRRVVANLAVHNPTLYAAYTLRRVLVAAGIAVDGSAVDVDDVRTKPNYGSMERVATTASPTLMEIAQETNLESVNLFAEHLLRTLGAHRYRGTEVDRGSVEAGVLAMQPILDRAGIEDDELQLLDGSGLSFMNRMTPAAVVKLLRYMGGHADPVVRAAYFDSLPVGGRSGTLANRFPSGDARGNVRAKTGYINGVRSLSGYVVGASGQLVAFSILCNHYATRTRRVNEAQDDVVELLADYARP